MRSTFGLAALALFCCGVLAGAAEAASPGRIGRPSAASEVTQIDLVTKCWRTSSGRERCRTFYVNPNKIWNPDRYRVGSTEWWRAMDRRGSGGYRQ